MKKKWIWLAVVLLIVVLAAVRNISKRAKSPEAVAEEVGVVVAQVVEGDLLQTVTVAGTIKSELEINLVPKAAGKVLAVNVEVGDKIRAGQVLVRLDDTDYRSAVRQAEAGLASAKARLAQLQAGVSASELKQAQAQVEQARIARDSAEKALAAAKHQYENRTSTQSQIDAAQTQVSVAEAAVKAAETNLASAKARAQSAQTNLGRMEQLYSQDAITKQQLEGARLEAELAQAQVEAARSQLAQAQASLEGSKKGLKTAQSIHSDRTLAKQQVDAAQSQLDSAIAALKAAEARYEQLAGGARAEDVAMAKASVKQAEAALEQARQQLASCTITSPIDGVVAQRFIQPGEMASPAQPLLILVQPDQLTMEAEVGESIIPHLAEGEPAFVEVDALPGKQLAGKIKNLAPAADSRSRGFLVRVAVEGAQGLKAGMLGRMILQTAAAKDVLKVPRESIIAGEDGSYVFVVKNGKAQRTPVELGLESDNEVEVRSGLKAGDQVVIRGQDGLSSGVKVVVLEGGSEK